MPPESKVTFFAGVIEGFYGRPWSMAQRLVLFERMAAWGLDTYCYGPKDDLKHRALWREEYRGAELDELIATVTGCRRHGLRFIYALSPGLDLECSAQEDRQCIRRRFHQLLELGVRDFALLFDDIPVRLSEADRGAFDCFAAAHALVANDTFQWLREQDGESSLLFCPTAYCGRMDSDDLGGAGYLDRVGKDLSSEIGIFWTGPEIISETIDRDHLNEIAERTGRRPVLWDNLHANDYDSRRLFVGPYQNRYENCGELHAGVLLNPNCEFEANFVPLRTLANYARGTESQGDPRSQYLESLREWLPLFSGVGDDWTLDDLQLLSDCFYLPHEEGNVAQELITDAAFLLENPPQAWNGHEERFRARVRHIDSVFTKLTELENRELFHTFHRRWWDLREEMQLLIGYVDWKRREECEPNSAYRSPEHLPGTYRGGVLNELQRLLDWNPAGEVRPR